MKPYFLQNLSGLLGATKDQESWLLVHGLGTQKAAYNSHEKPEVSHDTNPLWP